LSANAVVSTQKYRKVYKCSKPKVQKSTNLNSFTCLIEEKTVAILATSRKVKKGEFEVS